MSKDLARLEAKIGAQGIQKLNMIECLALIFNDSHSPLQSATLLWNRLENLRDLEKMSIDDLCEVPGIGKSRAMRLQATIELARRLNHPDTQERPLIEKPSDAVQVVQPYLLNNQQEQLLTVLLDTHNRLIDVERIYVGSLNTTAVRTAEVFRGAIVRACASIIVVHNHPSGNSSPSTDDVKFTSDLVQAGQLLDIIVLDHLILGEAEWTSMRERGLGF